MIVISDTNILSSMAAGAALPLLLDIFAHSGIAIPSAVQQELQTGLEQGKSHLGSVIQAIQAHQISVILLSAEEELLTFNYPSRLGDGEREAIAVAQIRKATLLSNDNGAVSYCRRKGIQCLDLAYILRLLWTSQVLSQEEVRDLIERMKRIERLAMTQEKSDEIFAPE